MDRSDQGEYKYDTRVNIDTVATGYCQHILAFDSTSLLSRRARRYSGSDTSTHAHDKGAVWSAGIPELSVDEIVQQA